MLIYKTSKKYFYGHYDSMRISPINNFFNKKRVNFCGKEPDSINRLGMEKPDGFVRSSNSIDIGRLKNLDISHFRLINSNSVRGVTLANQSRTLLTELKECGINTVIDLRQEGGKESKYAKACAAHGLDDMNFKLKLNMPIFNMPNRTKFSTEEREVKKQAFLEDLQKFFKKMDEGKLYMACLLGLHRTDLAVTLNYLLNPNEPSTPPTLSHMFIKEETNFTNKYIGAIKTMLKNLTQMDREKLGFSENFREIFDARILKLRMMNCVK